ncbi:hypothetical protein EFA46_011470 (plasmid) [Halarchaeum sp. CBA1220]|uniref:DUF4350 domain-containing protein n=1 Tax=Halarchaeum sp. CBA1220 TaxID=1853682 RepID=UPI000F3AA588|nr:DUF4350 domain-containing protein [Halarchaeum sp. CBA1220]QLC34874.1 hypothetical protein EFA46_011470 [Halarchaeum sp. CBA1220]
MQASDLRTLVVSFAAAVLLVVAVTAGTGVVADYADGPRSTQPDAPAYDAATLLADPVADDGTVPTPDASESKTVVVDVSHGNAVSRSTLQPLVNALVAGGHEVRFYGGGSSPVGYSSSEGSAFARTLQDADALVVANPASAYTGDEVDTVEEFSDAGGRVLLLADTPSSATSATSLLGLSTGTSSGASGQPDDVAARFGLTFDAGYLYDMTANANNFQYVYGTPSGGSEFAGDAERVVFDAAVPVVADDDVTTAVAVEDASYSTTRKNGTYPVVVRDGNVVAVGDTWAFSPDGATVADNEVLVGDTAEFLVSGSKTPGAPQTGSSGSTGGATLPTGGSTGASATA